MRQLLVQDYHINVHFTGLPEPGEVNEAGQRMGLVVPASFEIRANYKRKTLLTLSKELQKIKAKNVSLPLEIGPCKAVLGTR
jgi:hypothetical protein